MDKLLETYSRCGVWGDTIQVQVFEDSAGNIYRVEQDQDGDEETYEGE